MKKQIIFLLVFIQLSFYSYSQIPSLSEKAVFSILTVDVAQESHTLYGHTALRVKDPIAGFDVVYNYGMFDFRTPNFILKFTKGDLQYYAAVYPYADFEYSYREDNRSIYEQKLNLSSREKNKLFQELNKSVFSKNKYYTYKFIDRNCTTKVIDILNSVLKEKPIKNTLHKRETYREVLYNYQRKQYWLNLGINIIFGHRPDEQAKILFLPLDLMKVLETTQYNGKALTEKHQTLYSATKQTDKGFSILNSCIPLLISLSLLILINKKGLNILYFTLLGGIGVFFITVNLYSLHQEVLWNYNMLLFNPLYLVLTYFILKRQTKIISKITLICLFSTGIYLFFMLNKPHLFLIIPLVISNFILTLRAYKER
ncbi:lipoprotein N-acyltransferase Lnb domain-containing protein [Flavobacterium oreochromis]|uniref:lipoprotein N-acyltransferase Lnb domain-containing protein n=1 Tax=Flavobacterium oreochromis TaxID=2906078 RepID=UPI00385EFAF0